MSRDAELTLDPYAFHIDDNFELWLVGRSKRLALRVIENLMQIHDFGQRKIWISIWKKKLFSRTLNSNWSVWKNEIREESSIILTLSKSNF